MKPHKTDRDDGRNETHGAVIGGIPSIEDELSMEVVHSFSCFKEKVRQRVGDRFFC